MKRLDFDTGKDQVFDFGAGVHVGEPVFAGRPGGAVDEGWWLMQCLDSVAEQSFFAVFDAQLVASGPISKIWLQHSLPLSFHGWWHAGFRQSSQIPMAVRTLIPQCLAIRSTVMPQ